MRVHVALAVLAAGCAHGPSALPRGAPPGPPDAVPRGTLAGAQLRQPLSSAASAAGGLDLAVPGVLGPGELEPLGAEPASVPIERARAWRWGLSGGLAGAALVIDADQRAAVAGGAIIGAAVGGLVGWWLARGPRATVGQRRDAPGGRRCADAALNRPLERPAKKDASVPVRVFPTRGTC